MLIQFYVIIVCYKPKGDEFYLLDLQEDVGTKQEEILSEIKDLKTLLFQFIATQKTVPTANLSNLSAVPIPILPLKSKEELDETEKYLLDEGRFNNFVRIYLYFKLVT